MCLIKARLYTGLRVSELIQVQLANVDLDRCRLRVNERNDKKGRVVSFPDAFK